MIILSSGHILIVVAALLLDLLLGDPRWLPHPVRGIGRLITLLEPPLRRCFGDSRLAGVVLLIVTVGSTVLVALALLQTAYHLHRLIGLLVGTLLAWTCLAARSLHAESQLVADALAAGDLDQARYYLSRIVGRDTAGLDAEGIWRALVETVAENSSDGVIAPLCYLILGGPLLAIAYKAVNTLDSMVGYKDERYIRFGTASARCDDLLNLIPARLTGLLMAMAAPLVGLDGANALRIMRRDGRRHSSPNSGIPEAAAAGALRVQLGGSSSYGGVVVAKPTIGDAGQPLSAASYRGAVRLMYGAMALLLAGWLLFEGLGRRLL